MGVDRDHMICILKMEINNNPSMILEYREGGMTPINYQYRTYDI